MTDFKDMKKESYPKSEMVRDGLGIMCFAILGYFACVGMFILQEIS